MDFDFKALLTGQYLIWLIVGAVCLLFHIIVAAEMSAIAGAKGHSRVKHFIYCFLFGLAGYLIVIALPDQERAERTDELFELLQEMNGRLEKLEDAPRPMAPLPPSSAARRPAEKSAAAPARSAPSEARRILETALEFNTSSGMCQYLRRMHKRTENEQTRAILERIVNLPDDQMRRASAAMLARMR